MGTERVWLAGRGEPLTYPRVRDLFRLMGSVGLRGLITTNGALLTEELADELCDLGLQQVSVSIDSGHAETYARVHRAPAHERARILGVIRHLSRRANGELQLLASMVVSKLNCAEVLDFVRDATNAGVSRVVIAGMRPVPFDSTNLALTEEEWARVRADLTGAREVTTKAGIELATDNIPTGEEPRMTAWPYREMACFIGHIFTTVDVEGNVNGCCTCQNRLGSLERNSFREIWHGRAYRTYRAILRELPTSGLTPPQCDCRYACGHIPDNLALQQSLCFTFSRAPRDRGFATRLDLARALGRTLFSVPSREAEGEEFADLGPGEVAEDTRRHAANLRRMGVVRGTGSLDGRPLFDPKRLMARGEFAEAVRRALVASGYAPAKARELAAAVCNGPENPHDPLTKQQLGRWLAALRARIDAEPRAT